MYNAKTNRTMTQNQIDAATGLLSVVAGAFFAFIKAVFGSPIAESIIYGVIGGFFGMVGRWVFITLFDKKRKSKSKNKYK